MKKSNMTPLEKEWGKVVNQELAFLQKRAEKTDSRLNQLLEKKIPANLQNTLDGAFEKAFRLVFEKGTGVIEKTYRKDEMKKAYQINEYAAKVHGNKKALTVFSRKAAGAGTGNLLMSGAAGVGLGVLGIGLPDIALFTGLMLKGVYEIALNYGFDYEDEEEKKFILLLIRGALCYGKELQNINEELNFFMDYGAYAKEGQSKEDIYVGYNFYSDEVKLALPLLNDKKWTIDGEELEEQQFVYVPAHGVRVLKSKVVPKPIEEKKTVEKVEKSKKK